MGITQVKIVEKVEPSGKKIYGVQHKDGHVSWKESLPHARAAYTKATKKT